MIKISLEKELEHLNGLRDIFKKDIDGLLVLLDDTQDYIEETLMNIHRSSIETGRLTRRERVALRRCQERYKAVVTVNLAHASEQSDDELDEYDAVRNNELDVILARIDDIRDRMKKGDTTMQMPC